MSHPYWVPTVFNYARSPGEAGVKCHSQRMKRRGRGANTELERPEQDENALLSTPQPVHTGPRQDDTGEPSDEVSAAPPVHCPSAATSDVADCRCQNCNCGQIKLSEEKIAQL
ncbi:hypothetical protein HPB48_017388 [Haemaphysalis longicornis]|uniref:Uncharacterized protein n=1 Tax=Haemaphysalis longicornis TaxID=44386 RepID=A0A9J6GC04_HAELO|nr:hypothetical protein HPB48_017388 [Haemaphysalis longicornis]